MTRYTLRLSGLIVVLSGVFFATGCDKGSPTRPTAAFLRKAVVSNFNIVGSGAILGAGQATQLGATMKTPQGVGIVTDLVTWSTLDPNVATVSEKGLVTAVAIGTTSVKAVFDASETSLRIDVLEISGLSVGGALVNNSLAFTSINATSQLTLTAIWPGGITRQVGALATWSSSNPAIASVTSTGVVRSIAFGSTTITATYLTKSISVNVIVTPQLTSVSLSSSSLSLTAVGQTAALTATARFADASTKDVTTEAAWTSSDVSVATVSNSGVVTATGLGKASIQATYANRTGFGTVQVTPAGTFVILGRVRDPGQGGGAGLGVPGFTVRDTATGIVTTTNSSGEYSLGGIFPGDRVIFEKAGWETIERVFTSTDDDDSNPGAQRVVSISAGSTATINTAPNDVIYQLQPGGTCTPCRIVRVQSSTSGTLRLTLTWTGQGGGPRLNLWIAGQTYSSDGSSPIRVVANIPVGAGETLVYAGVVGGQTFATNYLTLTLTTSIVPAPQPGATASVLAAPAGDARRKR